MMETYGTLGHISGSLDKLVKIGEKILEGDLEATSITFLLYSFDPY